MVNPNVAGGAGEGNSKGGKGKGKMVMEDNSDGDKGKGKMIKTSKDDIPVLPELDLQSYETLAESLHKQMLEVKAWKEKSVESTVKEGKEKEEEEERKECPEWDDDPLALQLEEPLIHNLRGSFQTAIKKIAANGYSMEQAEWAVLTSGFYIGNSDITSNIVAAAMAFLAKKEFEIDPSERYIFENVENLANYALVEMVNVLKQVKPYLSVGDAMWLLLLFDLNLIQAASEGQSVDHFSQLKSSTSTGNPKVMAEMKKNSRGETTVYDVPATTTIVPEFEGAKRGIKATGRAPTNVPGSSRKVTMKTQRSIDIPAKKATETPKTEKDEVIAALTQRKEQLERA
nr:putative E3 ubiquitin-protein ligase RF298 isoform X1 [Ipomoea trifida]